ncbi:MAG: DUF72 domain-containing protein [Kiritimatiellae bacterium]|nr:DUF72 domain-containing protein [Kiritimatiellia bacterium]MDD5523322.1 DUF72 domain-containing protein [Kiritimatiellia bacterium]
MNAANQEEFSFNTTRPMATNRTEQLVESAALSPSPPLSNSSPPDIFFGVAGWSYPDWDGYVYSSGIKDKLGFIAGFVDMIEINNTFYRPPEVKTVESWIKRIEHFPHFFFTAKLHREITHEGIISEQMVKHFHTGFEPMITTNRLRHLLVQFKHDFNSSLEHREYLKKISNSFKDMANLTLELRHNSWQTKDNLDFLASLDVTVANLDYPEAGDSFNLKETDIGKDAYLRLHGRNSKAWFDKKAGRDETYDYFYSEKELSGIKDRAKKIARKSKTLTIVTNNHYQGKEVVNALQLKAMISGRKVPVPNLLLNKYPQLRDIVLN